MDHLRKAIVGGIAVAAGSLMFGAGAASAGPPVGTCTSSYTLYSYDQLIAIDPGAASIFSVVDSNGDGYVCFKPYTNGPHNGHLGNLVDNKAAPHE
ncbi:MAG TPA: hypothetical protein VGN48_13320 [Pedococcus sp.]|jgi:hypothetical protein|nr:hypothetical protein [Pedococcus sp.]